MQTSGPNPEKVKSMFQEISGKYDEANTVLSLGIHHIWRKTLVKMSGAKKGNSVLDCATGTGDLAIEFKKQVGNGTVVATDFCEGMLETAPAKAKNENLEITFQVADVMALPFQDDEFDYSSISFGIRNVADASKGLKELARVTKHGGFVMILEFGQPRLPVFAQVYNFYSKHLLPKIGGWVTGKKSAYEYLQNSSANFPCREDFVNLAMSTGHYASVNYRSLSGGIAYIYKCQVK